MEIVPADFLFVGLLASVGDHLFWKVVTIIAFGWFGNAAVDIFAVAISCVRENVHGREDLWIVVRGGG